MTKKARKNICNKSVVQTVCVPGHMRQNGQMSADWSYRSENVSQFEGRAVRARASVDLELVKLIIWRHTL